MANPFVFTQLDDIVARRSKYSLPINVPLSDIGLFGGVPVPIMAFEPDAATFHSKFYYNARQNILYKKLNTKPFPVWKQVGN